jgi:hypothetical protein
MPVSLNANAVNQMNFFLDQEKPSYQALLVPEIRVEVTDHSLAPGVTEVTEAFRTQQLSEEVTGASLTPGVREEVVATTTLTSGVTGTVLAQGVTGTTLMTQDQPDTDSSQVSKEEVIVSPQ